MGIKRKRRLTLGSLCLRKAPKMQTSPTAEMEGGWESGGGRGYGAGRCSEEPEEGGAAAGHGGIAGAAVVKGTLDGGEGGVLGEDGRLEIVDE